MKKSEIVMIILAIIAVVLWTWAIYTHDVNMEKACMDESWWVYVQ